MPSKVTFDDNHSDDSFSNALEEQLRREEEEEDELEWEDVGRTETVRRTARQTKAKGKSKTVSQEKKSSRVTDASTKDSSEPKMTSRTEDSDSAPTGQRGIKKKRIAQLVSKDNNTYIFPPSAACDECKKKKHSCAVRYPETSKREGRACIGCRASLSCSFTKDKGTGRLFGEEILHHVIDRLDAL